MNLLNNIAAALLMLTCCATTQAQPAAVKNAAKAMFTLTAYDGDGRQTASSRGIFVGTDGQGLGMLAPLTDARRVVTTDSKGSSHSVSRIIGINELYGVARFRAEGKTTQATVATTGAAAGTGLWAVGSDMQHVEVSSVETFMDRYAYYILAPTSGAAIEAGTPLLNDNGEVVALAQPSLTANATHAIDARFIASLQVNAMSLNDVTLQKINITPALPHDQQQAQLMLLMAAHTTDSLRYQAITGDFIEQYPTLTDGYVTRAQQLTTAGSFAEADHTMSTALKNAADKAEAHYQYGRLIYNKVATDTRPYESWTLQRAIDETKQAYALSPQPMYRHQEAQILFAMGDYAQAGTIFEELTTSNSFKTAELLFEIAQCRRMTGATGHELLTLLDSAINLTDTMQMGDAAPYFLMRGDVYNSMERYREAAFDYARYTLLTRQVPTADFYYIKAQTEVNGKLYQQALNDFAYAVLLAPNEPLYMAEMAQLYLRVNQPENALKLTERCITVAPDYTTGHVLHGLALIKNGKRSEGLDALAKAQAMGDEQAQQLIERYSQGD